MSSGRYGPRRPQKTKCETMKAALGKTTVHMATRAISRSRFGERRGLSMLEARWIAVTVFSPLLGAAGAALAGLK